MKKKGFLKKNKGKNMNSFLNTVKKMSNFTETENGASAHKSTLDKVYDMFAFGGAYRSRNDEDVILLFKNALEADETLALKCLFYLRDIRGGQGERRFFRVCMHWLAKNYPEIAIRNIPNFVEYGRWDDLYCLIGTTPEVQEEALSFMKKQLALDIQSVASGENVGISLLAKWMKSENASSEETKTLATITRKYMGLSHKEYRKVLSRLRTRINIVEKLMSENRWNEIEFDKIPSKAGLVYRNAFAHKDIIADKYAEFISNKNTKVNTSTLYPYEIVQKVTEKIKWRDNLNMTETEREVLNKYWEQQKDILEGKKCKMMCVIDTSGSMTGGYGVAPINVAISLGMYTAERIGEPFKNHFITFASRPQFIEIEGVDFVDKVRRIYAQNLVDNTNLKATFDLLKETLLDNSTSIEDAPDTLVVISDMEIDRGSYWGRNSMKTDMELLRDEWAAAGLKLPHLVYWNVCARNNIILDETDNDMVTYVSGCSPIIFESILKGKSGKDLMLDKLLYSGRYDNVG